jgi:hypothetical protein
MGETSVEQQQSSSVAYQDGNVVLRDGATVRVRVMQPEDEPKLVALLQSLSEEDRWFRFFSPAKVSTLAEAHREATKGIFMPVGSQYWKA